MEGLQNTQHPQHAFISKDLDEAKIRPAFDWATAHPNDEAPSFAAN